MTIQDIIDYLEVLKKMNKDAICKFVDVNDHITIYIIKDKNKERSNLFGL